jgi:hypothetical protein
LSRYENEEGCQILPVNFKGVRQCIQKLLNGNEIQDGCCGSHIEKAAKLNFEGNPPLDRQNTLCQFERNQTRHSKVIKQNRNSRWLHGSNIEKAAKLIFEGNPPLYRQNTPCQFERNQTRHSKVIKQNRNSRWLPWQQY